MKKSELLKTVATAYQKLDEALGELKTARRDLESAEDLVGDAFSTLEEIPDDVKEIEEDEKVEE